MLRTDVQAILGGSGVGVHAGAGGYGRSYPQCGSTQNRMVVTYLVNDYDGSVHRPRVVETYWQTSHAGDVDVRLGNDDPNTIDLEERTPYRERVYLRGGDDYVFQRANKLGDVVDCGDGDDTVFLYSGHREPSDRYRGCEHIKPYSP